MPIDRDTPAVPPPAAPPETTTMRHRPHHFRRTSLSSSPSRSNLTVACDDDIYINLSIPITKYITNILLYSDTSTFPEFFAILVPSANKLFFKPFLPLNLTFCRCLYSFLLLYALFTMLPMFFNLFTRQLIGLYKASIISSSATESQFTSSSFILSIKYLKVVKITQTCNYLALA